MSLVADPSVLNESTCPSCKGDGNAPVSFCVNSGPVEDDCPTCGGIGLVIILQAPARPTTKRERLDELRGHLDLIEQALDQEDDE